MDYFFFTKSETIDGIKLREEPELRKEAIIEGGARIENYNSYGKSNANTGLEFRKYNAGFPMI